MKEQKQATCYRDGKFVCCKGGRDYKENMLILEWYLNKKLNFNDEYAHDLVFHKSFVNVHTGEIKVIIYV